MLPQVNPESGKGMKTTYELSAEEFSDQDTPLTYSFGYTDMDQQKTR